MFILNALVHVAAAISVQWSLWSVEIFDFRHMSLIIWCVEIALEPENEFLKLSEVLMMEL